MAKVFVPKPKRLYSISHLTSSSLTVQTQEVLGDNWWLDNQYYDPEFSGSQKIKGPTDLKGQMKNFVEVTNPAAVLKQDKLSENSLLSERNSVRINEVEAYFLGICGNDSSFPHTRRERGRSRMYLMAAAADSSIPFSCSA
jgi:hypothetical protein